MKSIIFTKEDRLDEHEMGLFLQFGNLCHLYNWLKFTYPELYFRLHSIRGVLSMSKSKCSQRWNRYNEGIIVYENGRIEVNDDKFLGKANLIAIQMRELKP